MQADNQKKRATRERTKKQSEKPPISFHHQQQKREHKISSQVSTKKESTKSLLAYQQQESEQIAPLLGAICGKLGTKEAFRTKKRNRVAVRPDFEVTKCGSKYQQRYSASTQAVTMAAQRAVNWEQRKHSEQRKEIGSLSDPISK